MKSPKFQSGIILPVMHGMRAAPAFSLILAAQYALPLLALPFLARRLDGADFGLLLYMLNMAAIFSIFVDWGFSVSVARDIALSRDAPEKIRAVAAAAMGGKIILTAACLPVVLAFSPILPHAVDAPGLYWICAAYGLMQGLNPTCFFQGLGHGMPRMALAEAGSGLLALILTFACVKEDSPAWFYPLFLLLCKSAAYALQTHRAFFLCGSPRFSPRRIIKALDAGLPFMLNRLSSLCYTQGGIVILGITLPPAQVGIFVVADKIARALINLSNPFMQALFPEMCAENRQNSRQGARMLRWIFLSICLGMLTAALLLCWQAPRVTALALGAENPGLDRASGVLRAFCLMIPLHACNIVLGTQTLIARGFERPMTAVLALAGLAALPGYYLLSAYCGLDGVAFMPALVEGGIFLGLAGCVLRLCPEALFPAHRPAAPGGDG